MKFAFSCFFFQTKNMVFVFSNKGLLFQVIIIIENNVNKTTLSFQQTFSATWNVKNLFAAGKLDIPNAVLEIKYSKINILGMSDVQLWVSEKCSTRNGMMYFFISSIYRSNYCRQSYKYVSSRFYSSLRTDPNDKNFI